MPCAPNLVDAMTRVPDAEKPLVCTDGGPHWETVADPYPISDRWLSYGPAIELHGQGRRNPSMLSGDWTATPSTPDTRCHAQQVAVIPGSPTIGPPRVDAGEPGRALSFYVEPTMATIEISGDCLWQKASPAGSSLPSGW